MLRRLLEAIGWTEGPEDRALRAHTQAQARIQAPRLMTLEDECGAARARLRIRARWAAVEAERRARMADAFAAGVSVVSDPFAVRRVRPIPFLRREKAS